MPVLAYQTFEIEQMVRDAEANAAEDAKFAELAQVRNRNGWSYSWRTKKAMKMPLIKVTDSDKTAVEDALSKR